MAERTPDTDHWTLRGFLRPSVECRAIIGVSKERDDTHVTVCGRWRFHRGECRRMNLHNFVEVYYDTNRRVYPELSRRAALIDAWKLARKVTHNGGPS